MRFVFGLLLAMLLVGTSAAQCPSGRELVITGYQMVIPSHSELVLAQPYVHKTTTVTTVTRPVAVRPVATRKVLTVRRPIRRLFRAPTMMYGGGSSYGYGGGYSYGGFSGCSSGG